MDSSKKKSARVIRNFHGMEWLKRQSSPTDCPQRAIGPDGEVLSLKKTDEDYFPGTRYEKRIKKKKEKKGKKILTLNKLEDLMKLPEISSDLKEELDPRSCSSNSDENLLKNSVTTSSATVWTKDASTADKLFPNVKSVIINRVDEAEMVSRALAESIVTVQLEQLKRPTVSEEDRWEAMYGDADDEDEGGWDNVRRNLPLYHEVSSSKSEATVQKKSYDDNNNSSKPGILRNKQKNLNWSSAEPESLDFGFRKLSESLKSEIKAGRSLKSVSFSGTLLVKDSSSTSSENDEPVQIANGSGKSAPNIDKYGRVDGYSERRLFMGKGARMKELQYIQSKYNNTTQDIEQQNLKSKLQAPIILESITHPTRKLHCDKNLEVMTPEPDVRKLKVKPTTVQEKPDTNETEKLTTQVEKLEDKKPEVLTPEEDKPKANETGKLEDERPEESTMMEEPEANKTQETLTEVEDLDPKKTELPQTEVEKPTTDVENPKLKKVEKPRTEREKPKPKKVNKPTTELVDPKPIKVEKPMTVEKDTPEKSEVPEKSNLDENYVGKLNNSTFELTLDSSESSISLKSETEGSDKTESNVTESKEKDMKTINKIEKVAISNRKIEMISRSTQTTDDDYDKLGNKTSSENLQNNKEDEKNVLKDSTPVVLMVENFTKKVIREKESNSVGRCLVPTLVRDDSTFEENVSIASFEYTDTTGEIPEAEFQSAAYKNLLLTGVSFQDESFEAQSSQIVSQNLQNQNYFVVNPATYQAVNNMQQHCQIPNYYSPTPPNYYDTNFQFPGQGYSYILQDVQRDSPYQIRNDFGNNNIVFRPTERNENFALERDNTPFFPYEGKPDEQRRFVATGAPPGFVKKLRLPPGFTRNEKNSGKDDFCINSSESSFQNVQSVKDEVHQKKSVSRQNTMDRPDTKQQKKHSLHRSNRTQDVSKREIHRKLKTGSNPQGRKEKLVAETAEPSNQKCKILSRDRKRGKVKSGQDSRSQRNAMEEKSPILEENSTAKSSNNNYSTLDLGAVNNSSQSKIPVTYQIPNHQPLGFGYTTNRQYHANAMNPGQMPVNYIPSYQYIPLIPNSHNSASESYNLVSYQPLRSQMLNPMEAVGISGYPHASMRDGINDFESGILPPKINSSNNNSMSVMDTSGEVVHAETLRFQIQRSVVGNPNSNQIPMDQFVPKMPTGRGRGRLARHDIV